MHGVRETTKILCPVGLMRLEPFQARNGAELISVFDAFRGAELRNLAGSFVCEGISKVVCSLSFHF